MADALLVPCCSDGKCLACSVGRHLTLETATALAGELNRLSSPAGVRVEVEPPTDGPIGHCTKIVLSGGPYGPHVLCAGCSTRARVVTHWEGYVRYALEVRAPAAPPVVN